MSKGYSLGRSFVMAQTDRFLKIRVRDLNRVIQVPKRVVHDDSEVWELGHEGNLIVFRWWAEDEELVVD